MPKILSGPHIPKAVPAKITYAIKALAAGTANDQQQMMALDWIIHLTGYYDLSFRPDSTRLSDFAEGKRYIGAQLVKEVNIRTALITKDLEHG